MGVATWRKFSFVAILSVVVSGVAWGVALAQSAPVQRDDDELTTISKACRSIASAASELAELREQQQFAGQTEKARETLQEVKALVGVLSRYLARVKSESTGLTRQAAAVAESDPAKAKGLLERWSRVNLLARGIQKHIDEIRQSYEGETASPPAEEEATPSKPYSAAFGGRRIARLPVVTKNAVELGLTWLKDHQTPEGYWDCDNFMKLDKVPPITDGAGQALYDPGVTGLSLLAFLGAGQTNKEGEYKATVLAGLRHLREIQDEDGCFGPRTDGHFVYNHAVATLAMAEAYGMTSSPYFKRSAQLGIDFIHKAQNPYLAWRYGVRPQDNDTSVTGWMISALAVAKAAGLRVSQASFDGTRAWIDKATEPEFGRVGYTARGTGPARPEGMLDKWPPDKSESLTAVGILARVFCGEDIGTSPAIGKGADLCFKALPVWDENAGTIDMYYWYYATLAMYQLSDAHWKKWNTALKPALIDNQRRNPFSFKGSWDPAGPWGHAGGRVYSTALCTLMLETPIRYGRVFRTK